jgi:hypothetical protein
LGARRHIFSEKNLNFGRLTLHFDQGMSGRTTTFFAFLAGQSCCSALKTWAAQQRRPTEDVKILSCTGSDRSECLSIES